MANILELELVRINQSLCGVQEILYTLCGLGMMRNKRRGNLHLAEMGAEQADNKLFSSEIETARKIFLFLSSSGTRFFYLGGGTDREKLREIFCRIMNRLRNILDF